MSLARTKYGVEFDPERKDEGSSGLGWIVVAVLLVAAGIYTGIRLAKHGTDIIGVTTLPDRNTVIMNAKTGDEFVAGTGYLTVAEGEHIHLEYDLSAG